MLRTRRSAPTLVIACFIGPLLLAPGAFAVLPDCDGVSEVDNTDLKAVTVASAIQAPIQVLSPPGNRDRLFIVQQGGVIRFRDRGDPPGVNSVFLDISSRVIFSGEMGLLGMAFDPDFGDGQNDFFYLNYNEGSLFGPVDTVVARYELLNPDQGDPGSELRLMDFDQPQTNHNGGQLLFDDAGFLFVFTGDGGGADDEGGGHAACGNGQDLGTLLGKILRIDVKGIDPAGTAPDTTCMTGFTASGYTVPSDNPFVDGVGGNCDENWAYGLRNPWRASFDGATGDLYTGDVGQNCWEEVNYVQAADLGGQNYGWRQMEGGHCFDNVNSLVCDPAPVACGASPACNDPSLTDPIPCAPGGVGPVCNNPGDVLEYPNNLTTGGNSVIGGFVYRGCRMPNIRGTYFYGDNGTGFVRSFEVVALEAANEQDWTSQIDVVMRCSGARNPCQGNPDCPVGETCRRSLVGALTSFGEDARGEIYIANALDGEIWKIMPPFTNFQVSGPGAADSFLLSQDGNWTWEDLQFSSMHPVEYYQVYRGVPNGTFQCIHSRTDTTWPQGDLTNPTNPGDLLAYVVTAVSGGEETSSGTPERNLTNPCGPPI